MAEAGSPFSNRGAKRAATTPTEAQRAKRPAEIDVEDLDPDARGPQGISEIMDLGMLHLDPELRHEARVRELQKLDSFDVLKPVKQHEREHG
eukprot:4516807-Alexandrium_andersonii.AAC.1